MAPEPHQDILAEATAWHLRLQEGVAEDWDAFVQWLEADPARSDAYDQVEVAHAAIVAEAFPAHEVPSHPAGNDAKTIWGRTRRATILVGAIAAMLVAVIALPQLVSGHDRYEITTAAGERRNVTIADGSTASLNGATRLILDHSDPRYAELAAGEATFTVRHDADHPFTVISGDHRVQDAGTTFNLVHDGKDFAVEVIEGAVLYNPHHDAVPLSAGQVLHAVKGAEPVVARADPDTFAGWRRGLLSYVEAPMRRVAGDVSRTLGVDVAIDPEIENLPYTGSLQIQSDAVATVRALAESMGLRARDDGDGGWIIGRDAQTTD